MIAKISNYKNIIKNKEALKWHFGQTTQQKQQYRKMMI